MTEKGIVEIIQRNDQTVFKSNGITIGDQTCDYNLYIDAKVANKTVENWFIIGVGKWRMRLIRWILRI